MFGSPPAVTEVLLPFNGDINGPLCSAPYQDEDLSEAPEASDAVTLIIRARWRRRLDSPYGEPASTPSLI